MDSNTTSARDILKTTGVLKCSPDVTLKVALSKLTRSHDAVFVFDSKNKLLGCISPYYSVFKTNFPPDTKVTNALYRPPLLTPDTSLWDIASLMRSSKIYYLPVIEHGKFLGIVTINRILNSIIENPLYLTRMILTSSKTPITINKSATVGDAYTIMREKHISRLPVVDATGKLVGITTRYDIQFALAEPKKKQRFLSRVGKKHPFLEKPLNGYFKKMPISVNQESSAKTIIHLMISKNIGSVIVINKQRKPVSIISIHDILTSISQLKPTNEKEITIDADDRFIHIAQLETIVTTYYKKFSKYHHAQSLRVSVITKTNPAGKIKQYTVSLILKYKSGVAKASLTEHDWKRALRNGFEKIKRQLEKSTNK